MGGHQCTHVNLNKHDHILYVLARFVTRIDPALMLARVWPCPHQIGIGSCACMHGYYGDPSLQVSCLQHRFAVSLYQITLPRCVCLSN
jgi:hypothetical protein